LVLIVVSSAAAETASRSSNSVARVFISDTFPGWFELQ
jgi:hypothetical protein